MPNPIIQNYLNDEAISVAGRDKILSALKSGQSEADISSLIAKKHGSKYGSSANNEAALSGGLPSMISPPSTIGLKPGEVKTGEQINKENEAEMKVKSGSPIATSPVDVALESVPGFGSVFSTVRQGQQTVDKASPKPPADTRSTGEQLVTGAAKGVGSTVMGASELATKGMEAITKPLVDAARPIVQSITEPVVSKLGKAPTSEEAMQNMEKARVDLTTPKGFGEQVGFGAEQIGEFLFPSTAFVKGAKAAEGLNVGQKLLQLGKAGGKEALIGGAVTAAQRGNLDKEVVDTAILSGAIPVVGAVLGKVGALLAKGKAKAAETQISRLIKPNKNAFLFGKNPSRAIIDEGIVANSFDDLTKQIDVKLKNIGKEVQSNIKAADPARKATVEAIIENNIDDFGKKVVDKTSWKAYADKIQQLTGEFKPDIKTGELVKIADKKLSEMSAQEVWDMQKRVGKLTQWTGAVGEKEANKQLHKLYQNLGVVLEDLAPGTKDLQFRYANMLGAQKSTVARKSVAESNNNIVRMLGGAAAGGILNPTGGDNLVERGVNALSGAALARFSNSPFLRTRLAQVMGVKSVTPAMAKPIIEALLKEITSN